MSESGKNGRRRFVADTNVFVAAIKPFSKSGRGRASHATSSLALLLRLINDDGLELFANGWLLDEYRRLGKELSSETSDLILGRMTAKMAEVLELEEKVVARCRPYLPDGEAADVLRCNMPPVPRGPDYQRQGFRQDQGIWGSSRSGASAMQSGLDALRKHGIWFCFQCVKCNDGGQVLYSG